MPVIAFSKRDCSLVWKFVECTFNHQTYLCEDICCKRSKQTINASQDWYKILFAGITYFNIQDYMITSSRLYAKEFSFDKSSSVKQTTYQRLHNSYKNTFGFMPHVCYFSYHPWIAASEGRSLTTQEHQHPYPILLEFYHSSPSLFKNHEQPEVDKNILACKTLTLTESFVFSLCRCSKQSVSHVLTLNWSEHFI